MQHKDFPENKDTPQRSSNCIRYFNPVIKIRQTKWICRPRINSINIYQEPAGGHRALFVVLEYRLCPGTLEGAWELQLSGKSAQATKEWRTLKNQRNTWENQVSDEQSKRVQNRKQNDLHQRDLLPKTWQAIIVPSEACWPGVPIKMCKLEYRCLIHPNTHDWGFTGLAILWGRWDRYCHYKWDG